MAHYIDGFLLPIETSKLDEYKAIAQSAGAVWKEHGALDYCECVGDDLETEHFVSFKNIINTKENETVIFSWIIYPSREERDRINAAVIADPRMQNFSMPFDGSRVGFGGFKELVHVQK